MQKNNNLERNNKSFLARDCLVFTGLNLNSKWNIHFYLDQIEALQELLNAQSLDLRQVKYIFGMTDGQAKLSSSWWSFKYL